MMRRRLNRRRSKKLFRRGSKTIRANVVRPIYRGGVRL